MSVPINASSKKAGAPTPINTPVATSVLAGGSAPPTLSRPTVPSLPEEDIEELMTDNVATRNLLAGLVQGKLQGLIGRSSGYIESLSDPIKKTVEGLKGLDAQYDDLYKQFKLESLELEKKYADLYAPLFARRAAIVAGTEKPSEAELTRGEEVARKDFGPEHDHDDDDDDEDEHDHEHYVPLTGVKPSEEGIPDFWLTGLRNHVGISELVTERDAPALSKLKDVRVTPFTGPNGNGFKLEFEFAPNEWFTNQILTKSYYYQEDLSYGGELSYKRAEGTEIKWKDDEKNLTKSFEIKKQRNKNTNRTRLVRKAHPAESFFNFFSPPKPPTEEEEGDMDEDELQELEEQLELDYQIGEDLKERVIPKAIDFFTGKALEYEDFDEDEEDGEGFDDDEEEGDDDDEDDSDDDEEPAARRRRPAGAQGGGANAPTAEDCKQQ